MVDLVGRISAHLPESVLYLLGMLAGCNTIGVQAVGVPARPDVRGVFASNSRRPNFLGGSPHLAVRLTSLLRLGN